ncbi:MAG: TetR/AcrR family transcriptional regulator [Bdellovibrionaceae bacterium]|nr:TetR/AcrR family transcriptional regulator [Pseudobdellovibrionaceae bacterium]
MRKVSKGENTRLFILKAFTDLVFAKGFYSITLNDISNKVGISQQGIYKHFKSMNYIITSACLHWVQEAQAAIDGHSNSLLSAKIQLVSMVEQNMQYSYKNRKKDALLIGLYYYAMTSRSAMEVYQKIKNDGTLRIHALIAQGNRENSWNIKNPKEKAITIHSLLVGEIFKMIIEPTEQDIDSRIKKTTHEILLLLS